MADPQSVLIRGHMQQRLPDQPSIHLPSAAGSPSHDSTLPASKVVAGASTPSSCTEKLLSRGVITNSGPATGGCSAVKNLVR